MRRYEAERQRLRSTGDAFNLHYPGKFAKLDCERPALGVLLGIPRESGKGSI